MNANDLKQVYEALLCGPGLDEPVKIDLKINKRAVLLLSQVIDKGLTVKGEHRGNAMIEAASKEELDEIKQLAADCLDKAKLTAFAEKIMALIAK